MTYYRKRPIVIEAVEFTGDNWDEIRAFTPGFRPIDEPRPAEDGRGDYTAEVRDELHDIWIPLCVGDSVARGVEGEFYPVKAAVLRATYEQVDVS